jgi:N-acetylmuramoyl-L-alanine amidase
MRKIIIIFVLVVFLFGFSVKASLPLSGKLIVIDPGHGGIDMGTSYGKILEKDINLSISNWLAKELIKNGASVVLTRTGDYDLGSPNANRRKKSDFDNRIKFINESNANMYLSIHTNYLNDSSYFGSQVFYIGDNNKKIADDIQAQVNTLGYVRNVKQMPNVYMYKQLKISGVLIETGFISNAIDRKKLLDDAYQEKMAQQIVKGIIKYYN